MWTDSVQDPVPNQQPIFVYDNASRHEVDVAITDETELFFDESHRSMRRRPQRSSSSFAGSSAQNDDIAIHDALVGCRTVETFSRELLLRVGNTRLLCTRALFHKL